MVINIALTNLKDIGTTLNLFSYWHRTYIKVMPNPMPKEASEEKVWRIYQELAMTLVKQTKKLHYCFQMVNNNFVTTVNTKDNMGNYVLMSRSAGIHSEVLSGGILRLTEYYAPEGTQMP